MTKSKPKDTLLAEHPLDLGRLPRPISSLVQDHSGYVYVVELSNGMVKVGKTTQPRRRMSQHRAEGYLHGYDLSRIWMSPLHDGVTAAEAQLVEYGQSNGRSVGSRLEYFEGIDFDAAVVFARSLAFEPMAPDGDRMSATEVKAMANSAFANMATHMTESEDPELINTARDFYVGMAFGRSFYYKYDVPADITDVASVDALELAVMAMVRTEADRLRSHLAAGEDVDVVIRKILEGS